jgi:hypothetical protein
VKTILILYLTLLSPVLYAQTIVVNPDGTHSVVHGHGATKVVVNPDGTHSTVLGSGDNKTIVKADGTHSQLIGHGNTQVIVNPDGSHSLLIAHGRFHRVLVNTKTRSHTLLVRNRTGGAVIHPDKRKKKTKS